MGQCTVRSCTPGKVDALPDIYEESVDLDRDTDHGRRKGMRERGDQVARSGLVTVIGLIVLLGVLAIVWTAHMHGRIHQMTTTQVPESTAASSVRPGGQEIVRLERLERMSAMVPEFTSATLLPGDGMLMLQANLDLPGRGEVPLLLGTRESDLQATGPVGGAAFSAIMERRDGNRWSNPVELLAGQPATRQNTEVVPDGSRATAHYGSPAQNGMDVTMQTTLAGHALDVAMTAKNVSGSARSLMLSWQPRFLAAQGLGTMTLQLPAQESSAAEAARESVSLDGRALNQTLAPLKHSYLSGGPQARLRNHADGYTLVLTAMTPAIRSLHVTTSPDERSVLLAFSTAGGGHADDARTVLQPGETLQWHVRVEAVPDANTTPSQ